MGKLLACLCLLLATSVSICAEQPDEAARRIQSGSGQTLVRRNDRPTAAARRWDTRTLLRIVGPDVLQRIGGGPTYAGFARCYAAGA